MDVPSGKSFCSMGSKRTWNRGGGCSEGPALAREPFPSSWPSCTSCLPPALSVSPVRPLERRSVPGWVSERLIMEQPDCVVGKLELEGVVAGWLRL